jgi:3-phenylpropionate/cinnamic acid dioxygenase small subunit
MADERADRDEIADVLVRYATGIDTKDWPRFRTCFVDDVHADYGEIGVWDGVDAITDYMTETHAGMPDTKHMLSNIAIDLDGDEATASTYVHAVLVLTYEPPSSVDAVGRYVDRLVRTPDGWRIRERTFRTTRIAFSPPASAT